MKEFINNQRDLIVRTLKPLINSDYALLDVPNHPNIGDNLIWAGELAFLKEHIGYKCKSSANVRREYRYDSIPWGRKLGRSL